MLSFPSKIKHAIIIKEIFISYQSQRIYDDYLALNKTKTLININKRQSLTLNHILKPKSNNKSIRVNPNKVYKPDIDLYIPIYNLTDDYKSLYQCLLSTKEMYQATKDLWNIKVYIMLMKRRESLNLYNETEYMLNKIQKKKKKLNDDEHEINVKKLIKN